MKACQNCYYCNDSFQFAGDWWCACFNPDRSVEAPYKNQFLGNPVLKASLNLPCWRADAPSSNKEQMPGFSKLAVIRPQSKLNRINRLSRFYPKRNLTIPWSYVLRSKITNLRRKEVTSH